MGRALLILALSVWSALASAADAEADARDHYRRGAEAYDKGRYKDAVDEFSAADRLVPRPALAFNIARAYLRLGDESAALAHYRDYLRRAPDAGDRSEVERHVSELSEALHKKGVQQVTISSEPARATVVLDGEPVGVTPWTGDLAPGDHKLGLDLAGHQRVERAFALAADRPLDVSVTLESSASAPGATPPTPRATDPRTTQAPPIEPAPAERKAVVSPLTWAAFGIGAVAFGGAIGFEFSRAHAEKDAQRAPSQIEAQDRYDAMERRQRTSRILVGVGALATAAGGVLLYFDLSRRESSTLRTGFACAGDSCAVLGSGSF